MANTATPLEPERRLSWSEACRAIGLPVNHNTQKALQRYVLRRISRGAPDPRIPGELRRQVTRTSLLKCLPELRPSKERDILALFTTRLDRQEEKIRAWVREECELLLKRYHLV